MSHPLLETGTLLWLVNDKTYGLPILFSAHLYYFHQIEKMFQLSSARFQVWSVT